MITVNKGDVQIEGGAALLQAELACAVKALYSSFAENFGKEKAKKMVMMPVEDAFKTEDEIKKELEEMMKRTLKDVLDEVFGG